MTEPKVEPIDKNKLPWYYRLILKIPGSEFVESTSSGIFWGLIVPVFLVLEFALNITLLLFFPFPTNIALVIIIPAAILLVFLRVSMERFINWWNSTVDNSFEWNIEKTMPEYLDLLKKREEKKE